MFINKGAGLGRVVILGSLALFFCLSIVGFSLAKTETELSVSSITSSSYQGSYIASNAIDNNYTTYWQGASNKAYWWLILDLGATYPLRRISIWWQRKSHAFNYSISTSNDRSTWTQVSSGRSTTFNASKTNPELRGSARYVLLFIFRNPKKSPAISEIKIYANNPPQIQSLLPQDGSVFLAGAKLNIQVNAQDPENDPLEYQFSVGGAVKQAWSTANTYLWQTSASDTGYVNITAEVRDNRGERDSRTITYQIINPTVEEILEKVADNYALIYDFKADMVLSSTLNGQPFGETEYCRYYFKAPNREKTESFTDSSRTSKTEAIIIDGSTMYLIDTVKRITQPVDLLNEAGISSAQFNQMDIYYNPTNFLNNHTVTRNNSKTDFKNTLIALDAIPKAQNNLYSKLELYVDYNKGLLVKSNLYKGNDNQQLELLQTIEATETQQMSNGAWLPIKMNKIPLLKSGSNLLETATYNNLQINVGLTDLDFDPNKQY